MITCLICYVRFFYRNPESYFDVLHFPNPKGSSRILQRVPFPWCLHEGFQFCLPVICIDDIFVDVFCTGK
jgi:hypothetical protein